MAKQPQFVSVAGGLMTALVVTVALLMSVGFDFNTIIVGSLAQQQDGNDPLIYADQEGHLRMQTATNKSLFFNDLDLVGLILQQQSQLEEQEATNEKLLSTLEVLNSSLTQLPCRTFNPLPYPSSSYNYNVSVLGQGVHVDYTSSNLYVGGSGSNKWRGGILASNRMVYGAPTSINTVLMINPATNEVDITSIVVSNPTTFSWHGVVQASNDKLYFLPSSADHVLIIDPNNNNAVDQTSITGLGSGSFKWIGGTLAPHNGKIYCTPYISQSVLIIDPSNGTTDLTTISGLSSSEKWVGAVLANNELIYGIPYYHNFVLIINPFNDTADYTSVAVQSGSHKWLDGVLATNGKIYGMPSNIPKVLVIDPSNNNAISYIDITLPVSSGNWYGGLLTGKGKVVGIPANANTILIIDPETDTVDYSSLQVPSSVAKWVGGVFISHHNRIYGIPQYHDQVLQIDLDPCT